MRGYGPRHFLAVLVIVALLLALVGIIVPLTLQVVTLAVIILAVLVFVP
jgi:hypothetical protein